MNREGNALRTRPGTAGRGAAFGAPPACLLLSGFAAAAVLLSSAVAAAQGGQAAQAGQGAAAREAPPSLAPNVGSAPNAEAPLVWATHGAAPAARARKFDEFGPVGGCDHSARLDNFAIELMNDPDLVGYIVAYGPAGKADGSAHYRGEISRDYLVRGRGLDPARVRAVNGGRYKARDESFTQLWVAPAGAEPPRPDEFESDTATFRGLFSEYMTWDGMPAMELDAGTGPPVGNAKLAGFVDALTSQPEARAWLVVFHGEESAPGAWRRVAEENVDRLKSYGVGPSRVGVVFGGYAEGLKLQLWVTGADAPPPVADAGPERPPAEAVQLGHFGRRDLGYQDNRLYALKGLGDVLRADETLTAYLFVRGELPDDEEEESAAEEPGESGAAEAVEAADETAAGPGQDAADEAGGEEGGTSGHVELSADDLAALVESWRVELREKYGVAEHRLVVVAVPPRDPSDMASVETWVVPPGAAPPDPYADDETEEGEGEAVGETGGEVIRDGGESSDPDRAQAARGRAF
ncbi:MAG TPA: hypothetical protein VEY09_19590 [Pyrinomonadaceae bacterium]|nr:hypothetical protein [Pyrinomonadaceae bacterium]